MIAAFARTARVLTVSSEGGRALADPYLKAARRAAAFVRERMWRPDDRRLLRRYRKGHADIDAYAEDYGCLIFGLIELFQADPDPMWLEWAITLQHRQDELFWDEAGGGWFSTTGRDPSVLLRMKDEYDGAEPTASSMAVMNLLMLSHLVDEAVRVVPSWTDRIERTLGALREQGLRLIDETPRIGIRGSHVAFVHPKSPSMPNTHASRCQLKPVRRPPTKPLVFAFFSSRTPSSQTVVSPHR